MGSAIVTLAVLNDRQNMTNNIAILIFIQKDIGKFGEIFFIKSSSNIPKNNLHKHLTFYMYNGTFLIASKLCSKGYHIKIFER